ncbi:Transcriptional regulator, IclR family [Roseibacterium elongatum DSM 19469]|uniref:Transcriptional regulator, IclR family n=1 Tax=Roseicyclus elongatus DSM 19469 TaxID=1294273 RepID=W8S1I4_9RHOB|nr:HTH-type transcriptional regulator BhcR [Roseibacterium elongatum]AHM02591.1 Transcriptional regulator, IclR family [Roseibacterium elongatum DSM 19469]
MAEDRVPDPAAGRARGRPKAWDDKTAQNTIKSLDRAMQVFEHLSQKQGVTLSELAADLSQSPATVYRILVTLEQRDLVEFDPVAQHWQIGPQAFLIGARFLRRTSLVDRARPILRDLMEQTGETANLGIAREAAVLFVSQVETQASIRAFFPPGTLSPMHASGIGKALLSQMPDDRLARLLASHPRERFTDKTLTAPEALIADLAVSRRRGYAIDDEEKTDGMRCIAAPVFDMHGEAVAGLSVSGPSTRIGLPEIAGLAAAVTRAAATLSAAMGAPAKY